MSASSHDSLFDCEPHAPRPAGAPRERRRELRDGPQAVVHLTVETRELGGRVENLSRGGVLFFSEGDLRVSVEIEEHGTRRRTEGRLVRAQRLHGGVIGWAVEFDRA